MYVIKFYNDVKFEFSLNYASGISMVRNHLSLSGSEVTISCPLSVSNVKLLSGLKRFYKSLQFFFLNLSILDARPNHYSRKKIKIDQKIKFFKIEKSKLLLYCAADTFKYLLNFPCNKYYYR